MASALDSLGLRKRRQIAQVKGHGARALDLDSSGDRHQKVRSFALPFALFALPLGA